MRKPVIGIGSDVQPGEGGSEQAFGYLTYVESLRRAGAVPVLIPPQPDNAPDLVASLDGILLAGGADCDPAIYGQEAHPTIQPLDHRRQSNDLALAKLARETGVPALGICLGMQIMNVACGGTLIQDINSHHSTDVQHASEPGNRVRHDVLVEHGTRFAEIVPQRELNVNSSHHQAVRDVAAGLRVIAHAPDGIVEGIEDPAHPFYLGVQWHPEDMNGDGASAAIFAAFVAAARKYADEKSLHVTTR